MKIYITMKTPDAAEYALQDLDLDPNDKEDVAERINKWFKYGELLTVEFDTDNNTMIVVKPGS